MSDREPIEPDADGIEEGKRLIRVGGDKGLSLTERFANQVHRFTWRTPLHALRLRGRFPLKLVAVPEDPMPGDARVGIALLKGEIAWRGETLPIAELDFAKLKVSTPLMEYLHGFGWLRDLDTAGTRAAAVPVAESIMRKWLAAHGDTVSDPAWHYDLCARRILLWSAHAPLILSSGDLIYRSAVLNGLARTARHLDRGADRAPPGAARIAAWAGVVAAGLLIPGGQPRRAFGEAGLIRALDSGFFSDGGLISRSPAALLETIELLAMLRQVYACRRERLFQPAQAALDHAVPALLGMLHGDGALASWQGGGPLGPERVEAAIAATGVRARPLRQARDWGYQRLAAGNSVVIMDAAPPPVSRLATGGCASTLAFELSDGPHRIVVNCGGAGMGGGWLPDDLAEGLRTTAAHSTLILNDHNSTAIHPDGSLGKGVGEVELDRQENEGGSRLEASHDGYARRFGLIHRRTLNLSADGRELTGGDALEPTGRRHRDGVAFALRFHLAPGIEISALADGQGALLRVPGGPVWQFRCNGGMLSTEESLWVDGKARPRGTRQLVISGEAHAGGTAIGWVFKRAGQ
ncbi:putative heparinase superfamily protein [Sphingomonas zeicaulis]|uniref:heparinase II/III family protein n=1 Tax=Sphingomonas zeicaulis TaxID=1632740 RepID=UPI003D1C6386